MKKNKNFIIFLVKKSEIDILKVSDGNKESKFLINKN